MMLQIIVLLFFLAVLLGLITLYIGYAAIKASPAFELKKRLRNLALKADVRLPSDVTAEILQEMTPLDRFIYKFRLIRRLDKFLDNAGLKIDVKVFILLMLISSLAGLTLGIALGRGILPALVLLLIGGAAPLSYLKIKKSRRIQRFTEQFPNALDMISRSLKAGHAISSAIQMVGNEMSDPIAGLFKTAYEEQTLGLTMKDALAQMLERMRSVDLRLFVTAVNIHREVGGNLAETLEKLAETIRERIRIRRQVRVYTAQGRLSGYILAALPIFVATFLYFTAPDYIGELIAAKVGRYAIGIAIAGQIIGFLIIRKLINIRI